jgi:hypothetical protein
MEESRPAARAVRFARGATADGFRFLAADERRAAYLALLHGLLERRRAHEVEVAHEELHAHVAPAVEALEGRPYGADRFRDDLDHLHRWKNVTLRLEPARIRSIADRRRERFLVRLEAETAALLEFLELRLDQAGIAPAGDAGANLLQDIADGLEAARKSLQRGAGQGGEGPGSPDSDDQLVRALHLVAECDARTDRVARELVELRDLLVDFVAEPFRVAAMAGLTQLLDRYLDAYLGRLQTAGERIRRQVGRLLRKGSAGLLLRASEAQAQRAAAHPFGGGVARPRAPEEVLGGLVAFFAPGGRLESLCQRVNRETREAVRRIHRYVEEVRLKNVRTEAIRARAAELAQLAEGEAEKGRRFIERLIASAHVPSDAREGTPAARAAPFRPARRHESRRPPFRGRVLEGKRSTVKAHRETERKRLDRLSSFILGRLLGGRPRAPLSAAPSLVPPGELRDLVEAVKAFYLHGGKRRALLRYAVEKPAAGARARLAEAGYVLTGPDYTFLRLRRP